MSAACLHGCCEAEDIETTGWLTVPRASPCPTPGEAQARFEAGEGYIDGAEDIVSVNGEATREDGTSWVDCCYDVMGSSFEGTERACVRFEDAVGPEPPTCPTATEVLDELRARGTPTKIASNAEQVVAGPQVDGSQPLLDRCGYPVTGHTAADTCG